MNYNYEALELMMEGVDIMDSMINALIDSIMILPNCEETARLKKMASRAMSDKAKIYETLSDTYDNAIDMLADEYCTELDDEDDLTDENYTDAEIFSDSELQELLTLLGAIFSSGSPVSISADIYINENKDGNDKEISDNKERNGD